MSFVDRLPEQMRYRDDGCEISSKCMECPLSTCRYEMPPKRAGALMRKKEVEKFLSEGYNADEIAEKMDINIRTVFRLKKYSPKEFTKVIPLHTAHQESSRGGESENQPVLSEWQIAGKLMKMAWRNPDVWKTNTSNCKEYAFTPYIFQR